MTFFYYTGLVVFLFLSCMLMLLVLIQKGRGGGLSAAFGGVGGNTAFGAKTGDVLTWATSAIFGIFLLLAIGLNLVGNRIHTQATRLVVTPATQPVAAAPSADGTAVPTDTSNILSPPINPTPTPPPSPTTNPSTNPTRVAPATQP